MPRHHQQPTVHWDEAAAALIAMIRRASGAGGRAAVVVGITGPVGSGKTTLAGELHTRTGAVVLSTDHYLPDYAAVPESERDDPERADLATLSQHLNQLRDGSAVERPEWCFQTHARVGTSRVDPAAVIVCEGIFALHESVLPHLDLAVFVEASAATRWARWERIEAAGERGWGVEHARRYFAEVADPAFSRHADMYRRAADIVVVNDRDARS